MAVVLAVVAVLVFSVLVLGSIVLAGFRAYEATGDRAHRRGLVLALATAAAIGAAAGALSHRRADPLLLPALLLLVGAALVVAGGLGLAWDRRRPGGGRQAWTAVLACAFAAGTTIPARVASDAWRLSRSKRWAEDLATLVREERATRGAMPESVDSLVGRLGDPPAPYDGNWEVRLRDDGFVIDLGRDASDGPVWTLDGTTGRWTRGRRD
jgi:hypothetical protein